MAKRKLPTSRRLAKTAFITATIMWFGIGLALFARTFLGTPFNIPTASMEPTLPVGSTVMVDKRNGHQEIKHGDVIVFRDPGGWLEDGEEEIETPFLAKRVIGLGDDIVAWDPEQGLTVNGEPVDEPYTMGSSFDEPFAIHIPEDKLWVMGDNRSHSKDSMYYYKAGKNPFVPLEMVEGRSWFVLNGTEITQVNVED